MGYSFDHTLQSRIPRIPTQSTHATKTHTTLFQTHRIAVRVGGYELAGNRCWPEVGVRFKPDRVDRFEKDLKIVYGEGTECYVKLAGVGENVNVKVQRAPVRSQAAKVAIMAGTTHMHMCSSDHSKQS